jgi:hypothetical protein
VVEADRGVILMKRVVAACLAGSTIEFYDFYICAPQQLWCFPPCSSHS